MPRPPRSRLGMERHLRVFKIPIPTRSGGRARTQHASRVALRSTRIPQLKAPTRCGDVAYRCLQTKPQTFLIFSPYSRLWTISARSSKARSARISGARRAHTSLNMYRRKRGVFLSFVLGFERNESHPQWAKRRTATTRVVEVALMVSLGVLCGL